VRRIGLLGAVILLALSGTACTGSGHHSSVHASSTSSDSSSSAPVTVSGLPAGRTPTVRDTGPAAAPGTGIAFASHIYSLGPTGPLPAPVTVTIATTIALPAGDPVVVATRESTAAPWTYLAATATADRRHVRFTTSHFSLFGVLFIDLKAVAGAFKSGFLDGLDSGATETDTAKPSCANQAAARQDGYSISSSSTDTVYWCFGINPAGHRVLKVTDHRRYPLQVLHPNMAVLSDQYGHGELAALSHLGSGAYTIIAPGGTATFNADLDGAGSEGITTQMDGLGQSLYALQTGVETLVQILTKFGAGSGTKAIDALDKMLMARSCTTALGKGPGALVSGCFSPKNILHVFGVKGLLLAPIMAVGSVISFFHSEWNALLDQFNGHDKYQVSIRRKHVVQPLLGEPWAPYQEGFGKVAPTQVSNGGDPSGSFTITWDNWGGKTADGYGIALWVGDADIADGKLEPARFRAFDLGTCNGKQVYLHLAVWFPQHGQSFGPQDGEANYLLCPS